ncbi:MAG: class I SAM-dependent methyltransferase [Actinomycetota bacterium]
MCTSHPTLTLDPDNTNRADGLDDRIVEATIGTLELFAVHLGNRLGLYEILNRQGPLTFDELAANGRIDARYAQEWLEQQAVAGYLSVDDPAAEAQIRRYSLPEEHRGVLADPADGAHVAPLARMLVGIANVLDEVEAAYRTGDGVAYERYGAHFRNGQGGVNRPAFENDLVDAWLPAVPGVEAALANGGRLADVGCGQGWSTVAIAKRWPTADVVGVDMDAASIADARTVNEKNNGAARFATLDGGSLDELGSFDVVTLLEALHDMAHPVDALRSIRGALQPGGVLVVADELVADDFMAPGDELERMMYGWSVSHCLPAARAEQDSAALGTVLRADTVRALAAEAGFGSVDVVDVDGGFFRIYALRP